MGQIDFNKVWANFVDTVTNHYVDFNGRVGPQQFWFYCVVWLIVFVIANVVGDILRIWMLPDVVALALLLPTGGIAARRIQDSGNNGQFAWLWIGAGALRHLVSFGALNFFLFGSLWELVNLIWGAATVVVIYYAIQKGSEGDNQYGPPPPAWSAYAAA